DDAAGLDGCLFDGGDDRGSGGGRLRAAEPAGVELGRATDRRRAVPADPEREWLLHGQWGDARLVVAVVLALEGDGFAGPEPRDELQRLVGPRTAALRAKAGGGPLGCRVLADAEGGQ